MMLFSLTTMIASKHMQNSSACDAIIANLTDIYGSIKLSVGPYLIIIYMIFSNNVFVQHVMIVSMLPCVSAAGNGLNTLLKLEQWELSETFASTNACLGGTIY